MTTTLLSRHPYAPDDRGLCATCRYPEGAIHHVTDDTEPVYTDRWQFAAVWPELCVCDTCGARVGPVSSGWAHEFSSADALAAHDFAATQHRATVQGHEQ